MHKLNEDYINYLTDAMVSLENKDECRRFIFDLFTFQELESVAQRLQVARLLREGKSYIDINKETGASTATISRVGKCLNYGDGGYDEILNRLEK